MSTHPDANKPPLTPPTDKMRRLHAFFVEQFGEPEDLWVFDPAEVRHPPPYLRPTHVMVWPADDKCDVTTFQSLGMSERLMPGRRYFAELHWGIRGRLNVAERHAVAQRIADFCTYPFQHGLALDWWQVLADPGPLPHFPNCPHLLLHPDPADPDRSTLADPTGPIKLLYLIPITARENEILLTQGKQAFIDDLAARQVDVLADRPAG